MKAFIKWNEKKIQIEQKNYVFFHEREIFYASIGENIGYEQSGKGELFIRPVLVYKKFNNAVFYGIPLSTTSKRGKFYFVFSFMQTKQSVALLSQLRLFDAKRLHRKIGKISKDDFVRLKERLNEILL